MAGVRKASSELARNGDGELTLRSDVTAVGLGEGEPHCLELSDGTRLVLDCDGEGERVAWKRTGSIDIGHPLSCEEALKLAGEPFEGYVRVRTVSEAEWMRSVADWYRSEAEQLESELRRC